MRKHLRTDISVEIIFRPKPYEVDFTGFLSNTVTSCWMETLRVSIMDTWFPSIENENSQNLSVVCDTKIKYLKPITYSDTIKGYAHIKSASYCKWTIQFYFNLIELDYPAIVGEQTGAFIDPVNFQPQRMPKTIENILFNNKKEFENEQR